MKKQQVSFLTIVALLVQCSGVYAMEHVRGMWDGTKAAAQKYVGAMGRVASAMGEDQRFQDIINFLIVAGNKAKEGPQVLYHWLQEHKKTATGIVLAIILVMLSLWWKKGMVHRIPQRGISWDAALEHYNIQKNDTKTANFLKAVAKTDLPLLYQYYEGYEIDPSEYQYLLDKNTLNAARAIIGTHIFEADRLAANIVAYFQAMSDLKPRTDQTVKVFRENIEKIYEDLYPFTELVEIASEE